MFEKAWAKATGSYLNSIYSLTPDVGLKTLSEAPVFSYSFSSSYDNNLFINILTFISSNYFMVTARSTGSGNGNICNLNNLEYTIIGT